MKTVASLVFGYLKELILSVADPKQRIYFLKKQSLHFWRRLI